MTHDIEHSINDVRRIVYLGFSALIGLVFIISTSSSACAQGLEALHQRDCELVSLPYYVIESITTPNEINRDVFDFYKWTPDNSGFSPTRLEQEYIPTLTRNGSRYAYHARCNTIKMLRLLQYLLGTPINNIKVTVLSESDRFEFVVEKLPGESSKMQASKSDLLGSSLSSEDLNLESSLILKLAATIVVRRKGALENILVDTWSINAIETESGIFLYTIVPFTLSESDVAKISVSIN